MKKSLFFVRGGRRNLTRFCYYLLVENEFTSNLSGRRVIAIQNSLISPSVSSILMAHRFTGDFARLESEERKKMLPAPRILRDMKIHPGDTLIDFGCGIGYFSIPALDFVGDQGTVIAIDVSEEMLRELLKRSGHRKNLQIIQGDSLQGLHADIILLSMVLHEVDDPKEFLQVCRVALKPQGRIFVLDWQKRETGTMGPPIDERLEKEEVLGFTLMMHREHPLHAWVYFLEFF